MATGTSVFLIALGAILTFAVDYAVAGLDINTVGIILMAAGILGLIVSLLWMDRLAGPRQETRRTVVEERPVVGDEPTEVTETRTRRRP